MTLVKIQSFFRKKDIEISVKRYLIDSLSFMGLGVFSTLLIGTIINTLGGKLNIPFFTQEIWPVAKSMVGPAIGVAVAYGLKAPPLVIFASTITGAMGNNFGGTVGAFIAAVMGAEFGKIFSKETKIDILITPAVTILTGSYIAVKIGPWILSLTTAFGKFIMYATELQPFLMGALVSTLVGVALTLPISSAAICMILNLGGLAGGAATVGCSAQMIGFAVISFKDNGWGGVVAQGLGTSMLQISNIIKNWKIWIPPTVASFVLGPLATMLFKLENIPIGSGMGTSGLVGQFGTVTAMEKIGRGGYELYLIIILLHFILPAIISLVVAKFMYKKNLIKKGDLKLDI